MSTVLIYQLEARANDVLYVRGSVDGKVVEAFGWVSALMNHYDPDAYYPEGWLIVEREAGTIPTADGTVQVEKNVRDMGGNLKPDAKPRALTETEARAYCETLLLLAKTPAPSPSLVGIPLDPEPEPTL